MHHSIRIYSFFTVLFLLFNIQLKALTADFTVSSTIGCAPMYISITNISSGATSYDWDFGDHTPHSSVTSPTHTFYSSGSYTITLTAYSGSSSVTKSITINAYDTPKVFFRASDTAVCVCNALTFYDSSVLNAPGTGTYNWQFGNGDVSYTRNPTYSYCVANTTGYTVILKTTNSATCFSSLSKPYYIHVYNHPSIDFTANATTICGLSGSVSFSSSVSGGPSPYTYDWDFGDGSAHATSANPVHSYSSTTYRSYDVTLVTTTRAGCKDTLTKTNFINLSHVVATIATIPASATICANEYLGVQNNSVPTFDTTVWVWGDGFISTGNPDAHQYATSGTYTLKLITKIGSCYDSTIKTVTINPVPKIKFGATPLNPCAAPQTISFLDSTTGVSSYTWEFGDGTRSYSSSPSHTYLSNGSYDITLVGSNSYGCTDSLTKISYINIYQLGIQVTGNTQQHSVGGCIPFAVNFTSAADYVYPLTGITATYPYAVDSTWWDFGDGDTSMSANPSHTFTTYGTFKVRIRIKTHNGCYANDSFTVNTGPHPTANFSATPTTGCVDQPIHFTNLTDTATDYVWNFGVTGITDYTKNPIYRYSDSGHYTVTLIAIDNGCPDTITKVRYITINLPKAMYTYQYVCDTPKKIAFTDASKGASTRDWNFGDGSPDVSTTNPSHTFPSFGNYSVRLIVSNTTSGCIDTFTNTISILNPSISFIAPDTAVCIGVPVTFNGSVSGVFVQHYYWVFDRTVTLFDTLISIQYPFATSGFHTVKFMILDQRNCIDSSTRVNYILVAKPVASFSVLSKSGCLPFTAYFTDNSTDITGVSITTRSWDFGDTTYGTGSPILHTYNKTGTFTVKLVVTDNIGCSDSITKPGYIYVHKPTAAFFATPVSSCPGNDVTFVSTSSGLPLTYLWRFGDGATATSSTAFHSYAATGTYTVTLIVTDSSGCKDSIVKLNYIRIIAKPVANFTLDDSFSICAPLVVNFTNHSTGAVSYLWDFGDPTATPSTSISPSWTYVNAGIYTITLVVYNTSGCSDTFRRTVTLLGYKGAFSYSPLRGCAPLGVSFTVKVKGVPDFIYDFDDGTTYKTPDSTTTHIYTSPGPKVPRLIMTDDHGCSSESLGLDTILIDGVFDGFFVKPYPTCDSGTITLYDTGRGSYSAIVKHTWIFNDGTISHVYDPVHTYHGPGVYPLLLIDSTSTGCVDTFNSNVTFYRLPAIYAGPDTTICQGDAATLYPTGGILYNWSPAGTLSCSSCYSPKASPATATTYVVTGTDIHGCQNTDTITVYVKTKTSSVAKGSGEICQGNTLELSDSAGPYSVYNWIPAYGLDNPHASNPIAGPDTTVLYMAIATQASCIPDTQYVNVIVHPLPTPSLGPNKTMVAGEGVQLNVTGFNISKLAWSPTDNLSCDSCSNPVATPKAKSTVYTVEAWSDFGCTDSSKVTIFVVCDQSQVFMPNTFTPNGDGENDIFYPRGKGLQIIKSFRIYNRWGQMVFEKQDINTNQKNNGWDGTFKGTPVPPDVFVYIVDAICDTGEPMSWKGDISLIR